MSSYARSSRGSAAVSASGRSSAGSHVHSLAPTAMSAARIIQAIRAILFAGLAAATAAHAATKPAPAPSVTDTCLMCHADKDAKGAAGKSIAVDGAKFAASVHGEMKLKCTDCHADVSADKLPHPDKLKPVNCAHLPRQGGQGIRRDGAWHGAQGRQHGRRQLHGLPRHARHPALEGSGVAHQSRQRRGDVREVPRQRHDGRDGQDARAATSTASSTTASTARR